MIYGVISDLHCHNWSVFSKTDKDGVNSRLNILLDEIERAAKAVRDQKGNLLIVAGDVFHTRGTIDPEVLNPVRRVFREITDHGMRVLIIPGNHDLKSVDTNELSSAVQNLDSPAGVEVINEAILGDEGLGFVPWCSKKEDLLENLEILAKWPGAEKADIFIHAGIDGVIDGMPDHGLTAAQLAAFGFRNVFAGHYHNHKTFPGNVTSIGAIAHHNWGDINTKAGFLLVDSDTGAFTWHASHAPSFVDISGMDEMDAQLATPNNYVRLRGGAGMTDSEIAKLRLKLEGWGAAGISIETPRITTTAVRPNAPATGRTLAQSLQDYADSTYTADPRLAAIKVAVQKTLEDALATEQ